MSSYLIEDCLRIIFTELQDDLNSLYSCILVNRFWCLIGVHILWKNPFKAIHQNYTKKKNLQYHYKKFYNTIIYLLSTSSKQLLIDNDIILPLYDFSTNQSLFNYVGFFSEFPIFVSEIVRTFLPSYKYLEKYKILEQEVYKLFIIN